MKAAQVSRFRFRNSSRIVSRTAFTVSNPTIMTVMLKEGIGNDQPNNRSKGGQAGEGRQGSSGLIEAWRSTASFYRFVVDEGCFHLVFGCSLDTTGRFRAENHSLSASRGIPSHLSQATGFNMGRIYHSTGPPLFALKKRDTSGCIAQTRLSFTFDSQKFAVSQCCH